MAFLNRALTNFRAAVNARWPNRDKTSDGWIGDAAHQTRVSDHNPDPDGSVDAWDMDADGVDVAACIRAFERHESSAYWIYNRQIASRTDGPWRRRPYTGENPHTGHVHFNTREAYEDSAAPWIIEGETVTTLTNADPITRAINYRVAAIVGMHPTVKWAEDKPEATNELAAALRRIETRPLALSEGDRAAIVAGVVDQLRPELVAAARAGAAAALDAITVAPPA